MMLRHYIFLLLLIAVSAIPPFQSNDEVYYRSDGDDDPRQSPALTRITLSAMSLPDHEQQQQQLEELPQQPFPIFLTQLQLSVLSYVVGIKLILHSLTDDDLTTVQFYSYLLLGVSLFAAYFRSEYLLFSASTVNYYLSLLRNKIFATIRLYPRNTRRVKIATRDICAICLSEFEPGESAIETCRGVGQDNVSWQHVYHLECWRHMMSSTQWRCPQCRK